jgi:hypothetical protein
MSWELWVIGIHTGKVRPFPLSAVGKTKWKVVKYAADEQEEVSNSSATIRGRNTRARAARRRSALLVGHALAPGA